MHLLRGSKDGVLSPRRTPVVPHSPSGFTSTTNSNLNWTQSRSQRADNLTAILLLRLGCFIRIGDVTLLLMPPTVSDPRAIAYHRGPSAVLKVHSVTIQVVRTFKTLLTRGIDLADREACSPSSTFRTLTPSPNLSFRYPKSFSSVPV